MSATKIRTALLALGIVIIATVAVPAQTFTTLHNFNQSDGAYPLYAPLVQGFDGQLYGAASQGGTNCTYFNPTACGTIFKISSAGTFTPLYSFCQTSGCPDGLQPNGGLALNVDGNMYGTASIGGTGCQSGCGTAFKITEKGALKTLHAFNGTDGNVPQDTPFRAINGSFYGTTEGASNCGTIFKLSAKGGLKNLDTIPGSGTQGCRPYAPLTQGSDGNFYGTIPGNGPGGYGTIVKVSPSGKVSVLYGFSFNDGAAPYGGLVQGTDGNFYGTTTGGGSNGEGIVFRITPSGKLTTLHTFQGGNDGGNPHGTLIQATDGNFYGTTLSTVFSMTPSGSLSTLHLFTGADGSSLNAGVVQGTDGSFYGVTTNGGSNSFGTIFNLSVGLGPFAELVTATGTVGAPVVILGNKLTGTSAVNFGAGSATFKVVSDTEITTTVPNGATTDFVTVITPTHTLTSSKQFLVTPQFKSFSPPSGPVGTVVTITGVSLTQTTSVKFGTKAATFTVNSDTQITTTVPTGAKTGKITVTTSGGTATSATSFTVT